MALHALVTSPLPPTANPPMSAFVALQLALPVTYRHYVEIIWGDATTL